VEQQGQILAGLLAAHSGATVDVRIGRLALRQVPYLARLPLGVMAAFHQLVAGTSDQPEIVQRPLVEYFERAGLPRPRFAGEWLTLHATVRSLIVMATVVGADILWVGQTDIFTTHTRFEQGAGWTQDCLWELLLKTRLCELHSERKDACRFLNWDILSYLIAHTEAASLFAHTQVELTDTMTPLMKLVLHVKRYLDASQD